MGLHKVDEYMHLGVPEGEEREKGAESLFKEIIVKNFSKMEEEMDLQIQESQQL